MKRIVLKIPVEPEVKAYLDTFFDHQPCRLKRDNHISRFLFRILRDPIRESRYDELMNGSYSSKFVVHVSHHDFFEYSCNKISSSMIIEFNNYVRDIMREQISFAMQLRELPLNNRRDALLFIIHHFGIDENEAQVYERMKKRFDRYRPRSKRKVIKTLKILGKEPCSLSLNSLQFVP